MPETPPVVLSIAGYDPSSGAGVTADIKTAAAHGCYAVTCITALTVQSTAGVRRVQAVSAELVAETLAEVASDVALAAVRIGMLGSGEVALAVAEWLEKLRSGGLEDPSLPNPGRPEVPRGPWIVLDPVIKASSGTELLDADGVELVRQRLIRLADVVTPNLDEAAALSGMAVTDPAGMKAAAARMHEMGCRTVVITGGHLSKPVDLLSVRGGEQVEFHGKRVESSATHGTGCAFAMALACNLARGFELKDSARAAGEYVRAAIAHAFRLGKGKGPVNHLYGMREA
jgi:hydroxymethylpyrimidine/phosphomethylpyrimidine kinase